MGIRAYYIAQTRPSKRKEREREREREREAKAGRLVINLFFLWPPFLRVR